MFVGLMNVEKAGGGTGLSGASPSLPGQVRPREAGNLAAPAILQHLLLAALAGEGAGARGGAHALPRADPIQGQRRCSISLPAFLLSESKASCPGREAVSSLSPALAPSSGLCLPLGESWLPFHQGEKHTLTPTHVQHGAGGFGGKCGQTPSPP